MAVLAPATEFEVGVGIVVLTLGVAGVAIALLSEVLSNRKQMSDSGRDWGASSDESIRALNAANRDAKIENAIKQLDSLHAATVQYGDWKIDGYAWPHEIAICDNDCIVLATVTNKNSNNAALQREQQECSVGFTVAAHNAWPTISDELKRVRACKLDGMTINDLNRLRQMLIDATAARADFEKALNASEERVAELLRENAELNAKLDTEKRAAISIAVAALDTGCVKPESKGTVEAVNDMSAEISRLRELAAEMAGSMQTMHDMLGALDYPMVISEQSKANELIRKAEGVVK